MAEVVDLSQISPYEKAFRVSEALAKNGLFKSSTNYIIIGDEPVDESGNIFHGVIDLQKQLGIEAITKLKSVLVMMPRMNFRGWFELNILPSLEWDYQNNERRFEKAIWGAFIELFNLANLEYVVQHQLEPWVWESQKKAAYDAVEYSPELARLQARLAQIPTDLRMETLAKAYSELPPLGDPGLEINRQNAVKELLKQGEYDTVQAIIDAYRYSHQTVLDSTIRSPFPLEVNA